MTDFERRLRAAMASAVANEQPPGNLIQQVRRRHRRHTARVTVAGAAAVAVAAVLVPVGIRASGHGSGPAGPTGRGRPTVYAAYPITGQRSGHVIPIRTATNKAGKPIHLAELQHSTRAYRGPPGRKDPLRRPPAAGHPDQDGHQHARQADPHRRRPAFTIDINPNGKTAYVAGIFTDKITPINIATNTLGKPINSPPRPALIVFTPDGKTAYVLNDHRRRARHGHPDQHRH